MKCAKDLYLTANRRNGIVVKARGEMAGYFFRPNIGINLKCVCPEMEIDLLQVSLKKPVTFLVDRKSGINAADNLRG